MKSALSIEEWGQTHARWPELKEFIETQDQTRWAETTAEWHLSSHVLVALHHGRITGFLRFVIQIIGVDEDHDPVAFEGTPLTEAKVLAFGVAPTWRNQGIGRSLQKAAMHAARQRGCHQLRSHSSGDNEANHHLKLSLGFAVHPVVRDNDTKGVYFVMPLKTENAESPNDDRA